MAEVYKTNLPDAELLRTHFINEGLALLRVWFSSPLLTATGRVAPDVAMRIIKECTAVLRAEPTMVDIAAPITGARLEPCTRFG